MKLTLSGAPAKRGRPPPSLHTSTQKRLIVLGVADARDVVR
jgi:hypothetical protein